MTGISGIGKTELVLHVAARWLELLPAGTPGIHLDVRGFDVHRPPLTAVQALAALLTQLGEDSGRVGRLGLVAQQELLRRRLTSSPAVVVLDNVPDSEVLEAIVPTQTRSRFLATSRRALGAAPGQEGSSGELRDGSRPRPPLVVLALDPLTPIDSHILLARLLGRPRTEAEPEATRRLVELTGGLALDLTLAAASVANHPGWSIADHVHRLAGTPRDEHLRPALQLSYQGLDVSGRETFRSLGLYPGVRLQRTWVAVLLGRDASCRGLDTDLETLEREHLVRRDGQHLVMHDAVAAFARAMVLREEPHSRQLASVTRLARGWVEWVRQAVAEANLELLDSERAQIVAVAGLATQWDTRDETDIRCEMWKRQIARSGAPQRGHDCSAHS